MGNILTASNGTTTHSYTYGNSQWRDLLTAYDGQSITYDTAGNPTSYYNGTRWTFTWGKDKRLLTASDGTNTISFSTNEDGTRAGKTVNGTRYDYIFNGSRLMREYYSGAVLDFIYDADGRPYALNYNGTYYYYILNLQGDVIRLVNSSGATVASYEYDPYGKVLSATGSMAAINPLRYRGYYYDEEIGLYYLMSRYYDPQTGRFINADSYASTGQGFTGYNMFAYCGNSPVGYVDPTGHRLESIEKDARVLAAVMVLGAAAAVVVASNYAVKEEHKQQHAVGTLQAQKKDTDYTVYFLCQANDDSKTIIYVGRVKTENFSSRMSYHQRQGRELVGSISGMDYATCRAVEQGGMMLHHTINRGNPIYNQIRGISPNNPNLDTYIKAIMNLVQFGRYPEQPLLPISYWQNFCENEFLNSCG